MHSPHFDVKVLGRFRTMEAPETYTEKAVYYYEFEFYSEDYPGGTLTDGVFRPAVKGGFCLFKPGQRQRLVPPYRCYVLNILPHDPELKACLDAMPTFSVLWNMDEAIRLLQQMMSIREQTDFKSLMRIHNYAEQILLLVLENCRLQDRTQHNILRHQKVLLAADQYIREHLSEELSLDRLAKHSNLDPTYFHKLFTAAFGVTPARQILNYRIEAAKAGLLEENISMEVLAQRCGFSSASYFGNRFRQVTGMTPSQYRKASQEKGE